MTSGTVLFRKCFKIKKSMFYNMERKIVHFWQLPATIRFELDHAFCLKLFDKAAKGNYFELAEKLGVSYPYVHHLRRAIYSIPKDLLIEIATIAEEDLKNIEENIRIIKTRAGLSLKIPFPIMGSSNISSLVGHVFSDGCIDSRRREFDYSNTNPALLLEVENEVWKEFGIKPFSKTGSRITYPSVAGDVLLMFGAPLAPKLYSENAIPKWIMEGSESCKKVFLRAVFNDDGSVMYSKSFNAKGVNLYQTRHISKKPYLEALLSQIKKLLEEFDIHCGECLISRKYKKADGIHVVMYINITDYVSILNFYKKIGLAKGEKLLKLEKILSRKNHYNKFNENRLKESILNYLKIKSAATSEIANQLMTSKQKILKKLKQLELKGAVERIGKIAPNRAVIWRIKEVAAL